MRPEERQRRIDASRRAGDDWFRTHPDGASSDEEWRDYHAAVLNAADRAVPVVGEEHFEACEASAKEACYRVLERAERAEAAARDFAERLDRIQRAVHAYEMTEGRLYWDDLLTARAKAVIALRAHPEFAPAQPRASAAKPPSPETPDPPTLSGEANE